MTWGRIWAGLAGGIVGCLWAVSSISAQTIVYSPMVPATVAAGDAVTVYSPIATTSPAIAPLSQFTSPLALGVDSVSVWRPAVSTPAFYSSSPLDNRLPVVVASPAVASPPLVTTPSVIGSPAVIVASPAVTAPVIAGPTVTVQRPVIVRPKVYIPGRPIRNFFTAITP